MYLNKKPVILIFQTPHKYHSCSFLWAILHFLKLNSSVVVPDALSALSLTVTTAESLLLVMVILLEVQDLEVLWLFVSLEATGLRNFVTASCRFQLSQL